MFDRLQKVIYAVENHPVLSAIKKGFLLLIPVVLTGSFALLLRNFPIPAYQGWLSSFGGGSLLLLLDFIFDSTTGFLSIYLTIAISYFYSGSFAGQNAMLQIMAVLASAACFIASFGGASGSLEISCFGTIGVFSAMLCAILATRLFFFIDLRCFRRFRSYSAGNDIHFRSSMSAILPMVACVTVFALGNLLLKGIFQVANLNDLISGALYSGFRGVNREPQNGLVFALLLNLLWAFGVHGGNALDPVAQTIFAPGALQEGFAISKSFLDNFTAIGGSGCSLCLLLALLVASRSKSDRGLAYSSVPLAFFNINEILVFGLPIVLNPVLMIPFIVTPVVSMLIAYGAVSAGLMPAVGQAVGWTTPVFFSGYLATGSWRGAAVQLVILAAGTAIYLPFVRFSEKLQEGRAAYLLSELTAHFKDEEKQGRRTRYLERQDSLGIIAKELAGRLRFDVEQGVLPVYYQPQVNASDEVVGAEALLRWRYEGQAVYPPLVVALSQEDGCFDEMTWRILVSVCGDLRALQERLGRSIKVSANLIAEQLDSPEMVRRIIGLVQREKVSGSLVLEVTEETSLAGFSNIAAHIEQLGENGIFLAIDDFSMGQTSLQYLRSNRFRYVKLDGGLVRQATNDDRCCEIIASIVSLGRSLGFQVIAEWVETREIRDRLLKLGCGLFQGYLYRPALPLEEMAAYAAAHAPGGGAGAGGGFAADGSIQGIP